MSPAGLIRDRRGGVAIMAAAAGGVLCMIAALAIDVGSIALDARRLQGAADLAAMSAAANLTQAEAIALRTAIANSGAEIAAETVLGTYVADRAKAPAARFSPTSIDPNAVRVTLTTQSPLFFGGLILGKNSVPLSRTATATARNTPMAAFSIGSRLASLNGGVANQVLSGLTGSTVSLSVMDYRALADVKVDLMPYLDALATHLDVKAGDYDGLLDQEIKTGEALKVLETLAGSQAHSALSQLSRASAAQSLRIGDLLALEPHGEDLLRDGLSAKVSALDLAMAMLEIGGDERQIALDFGAQAGLASLKGSLAIGERPNQTAWLTVARNGEVTARTAQARLYLHARTSQKLSGLAQVDLPLVVELAASEARLDRLDCAEGSVTVGVRPGLARASIGVIREADLSNFKTALNPTPATLVSVAGLVRVLGKADVEIGNTGFQPLKFKASDIADGKVATVRTTQIGTSLTSSLLQRLVVDVDVLGLGIGLGGLTQALGTLLSPLGPVLDAVLNPLFDLLGLQFGEADVVVNGLTCERGGAKLVG